MYYLADRNKDFPAFDTDYFDLKFDLYWTNKKCAFDEYDYEFWAVDFSAGIDYTHSRSTYVVCVR